MPASRCTPEATWKVTLDPYDAITPARDGWRWLAQGYIQAHPCSGGTLTLRGRGVQAGGERPLLKVALDTQALGEWRFDQERTVTVTVPRGGVLSVAFMNAYYDASTQPIQRRELHLQLVRFDPSP